MRKAAQFLATQLQSYSILSNIDNGVSADNTQWRFTLNPQAKALGLTSVYLAQQLRAAFHGVDAITQHRGRDEMDVVVRLPQSERDNVHDIEQFMFYTPDNVLVRLGDVVHVFEGYSDVQIDRQYGRRVIAVTANALPKSALGSVTSDLEQHVFTEMVKRFPGTTYSYGGKQTDMVDSISSLGLGLMLALIMMLALLVVLFNNLIQPLFILLVIPLSFIGVVVGHIILGYSLSVLSLFGVVALTGIVINDGVVLLKFMNNHAQDMPFADALVVAAKRRFFPVMLTSVTTFLGLMPIILERSMQAKFLIPMAVSLAFGAIFAMLVTLLVLPAFCAILADYRINFTAHKHKG